MDKQELIKNNNSLVEDIRSIIEHGRQVAYAAVSQTAIATYWNLIIRYCTTNIFGLPRRVSCFFCLLAENNQENIW